MKKSATYYFLIQCCFYLCLGWLLGETHDVMASIHRACIPAGKNAPELTDFVYTIRSWPYVLAGISALGAVLSVSLSGRSRLLQHTAFGLLFAAPVLMLVTLLGYVAPFSHHWVVEDFLRLSDHRIPTIAEQHITEMEKAGEPTDGRAHDDKTVAALLPLLRHADGDIAEEARRSLIEIGTDEVLARFIERYSKDPEDSLALGVIRSLYAKRDRVVGPMLRLTRVRHAALAEYLSAVSKKDIGPANIRSIRRSDGALFVQVTFKDSGVDFIVIQEDDETFRAGKVILSWIT